MLNHSGFDKASILSGVHAVGSVADGETLRRLAQMDLPSLCDVVEMRVDTWPERAAEGAAAAGRCTVPVLATVRRPDEGGQNELSAGERMRLGRLFLPAATLFDIEIASLTEMAPLVKEAADGGVIMVASWHDFSVTPPLDVLRRKRDEAMAAGAGMVKFATNLRNTADIATLAALLEEPGHPPLSVMGMGALGRISRLLFAQLGSVLNYGWLDRATVRGQWPAARLRELVRELSPGGVL
jgi:3-dehydroquinate dehydratase-1